MSSPALSSDSRRSVLLQHRSSPVRLIDPVTRESVDHAKAQQTKERTYAIADLLAGFDDLNIRTLSARERDHYTHAAGMAMDAAKAPRF